MSRITHFQHQPKSVYYWDYYILCRLNVAAAIAIQRMEYWDGTKDAAIPHAEALNEALVANNKPASQDTSRWVYKAQDELQWELMGITGEKGVAALTKFLEEDVHYLESRHNPHLAFDRKKQYEFQAKLIQEHIHYLAYLIRFFEEMDIRPTPVHYAIELLTREGVFIDELSVQKIAERMATMHSEKKLPVFIKHELARVKGPLILSESGIVPFRNIAEWKAAILRVSIPQYCGMEDGKNAEWKTQKRGSNSSNYHQSLLPITTTAAEALSDPSTFQNEQTATAARNTFDFENVTEEEIALLQAYRQRALQEDPQLSENLGGGEAEQSSKQAERVIQADEQSAVDGVLPEAPFSEGAGVAVEGIVQRSEPIEPLPVSENVEGPANKHSEGALTAEQLVDHWEDLRKQRYTPRAREAQVQAAHDLLLLKELPLPLSLEVLKQMYEMNYDDFWQKTFGAFHLTHLLMLEKKSGEVRISSLMHRLPKAGSSSAGEKKVNYNEVVAMSEQEREEYKRQQQEKYALPGLDREAFMKLSPPERIAAFKALQAQQAATV